MLVRRGPYRGHGDPEFGGYGGIEGAEGVTKVHGDATVLLRRRRGLPRRAACVARRASAADRRRAGRTSTIERRPASVGRRVAAHLVRQRVPRPRMAA